MPGTPRVLEEHEVSVLITMAPAVRLRLAGMSTVHAHMTKRNAAPGAEPGATHELHFLFFSTPLTERGISGLYVTGPKHHDCQAVQSRDDELLFARYIA